MSFSYRVIYNDEVGTCHGCRIKLPLKYLCSVARVKILRNETNDVIAPSNTYAILTSYVLVQV